MSSASAPSVPRIAFDLRRTCLVIEHLSQIIAGHLRTSPDYFFDSLLRDLHERSVGTAREVVLRSLLASVRSQIEVRRDEATTVLSRLAGLPEGGLGSAAALQSAYLSAKALTGPEEQPLLLDLTRLLADTDEVQSALSSGRLAHTLAERWDTAEEPVTAKALDAEVTYWSSKGLDAERLTWALIVFESNKHIPLVWMVCNRLSKAGSFGDRSSADLFGYGWRGLRIALRHYDPATGFAFSTYGVTRITGEIRDGVRSEHVLPKRLTTYARKIANAEAELGHSLGRAPSLEELAQHLGEDLERLTTLSPRLTPAASLQELTLEGDSQPSWLIDTSPDPSEIAVAAELAEQVERALQTLPEEERIAVQLLLIEERSIAEVRTLTGATARQLRTRIKRGSSKLRSELAHLT